MDRHITLLGIKDVLEHLGDCYDQWQFADDRSEVLLIETMKRDLDHFRRLCDSLEAESEMALLQEPQVVA